MKPNIFFLVIDALRADRCFGNSSTAKTPNIDNLIKNSLCFTQLYGTSTLTGTCLGCTFSGLLPFKTGNTLFHLNKETPTIFDVLKNDGYSLNATLPNVTWFEHLTEKFDDVDFYNILDNAAKDTVFDILGNRIIKKLGSLNSNWIYYVHIYDLHPPIVFAPQFNHEEYGHSKYDKSVSCIDYWIGKFFEKIDPNNTLFIITSDHGDNIPKKEFDIPLQNVKKTMRFVKHLTPFLEPVGVSLFEKMVQKSHSQRIKNDSKGLTEIEKRSLIGRGQVDLVYDELIHIPLIIHGPGLPVKQISKLTRQVDTSPTILELVNLKFQNKIDGQSLLKYVKDDSLEELPAYIESGSTKPDTLGKYIGVRTSKFKYMRTRDENSPESLLFDLIADPQEQKNLADSNIMEVKHHENILQGILHSNVAIQENEGQNDAETKKRIIEEYRKLGYL